MANKRQACHACLRSFNHELCFSLHGSVRGAGFDCASFKPSVHRFGTFPLYARVLVRDSERPVQAKARLCCSHSSPCHSNRLGDQTCASCFLRTWAFHFFTLSAHRWLHLPLLEAILPALMRRLRAKSSKLSCGEGFQSIRMLIIRLWVPSRLPAYAS